jgi:RES domain-containing protein
MRLWRISNYADLAGLGGLQADGRWHSKGRPIIYTAETAAGAFAEMLVNVSRDLFPDTFQLMTIAVPAGLEPMEVSVSALPADWRHNKASTQALGDTWLQENAALLLRVPSALIPDTHNVLINPRHPGAQRMTIVNVQKVTLDQRLK